MIRTYLLRYTADNYMDTDRFLLEDLHNTHHHLCKDRNKFELFVVFHRHIQQYILRIQSMDSTLLVTHKINKLYKGKLLIKTTTPNKEKVDVVKF